MAAPFDLQTELDTFYDQHTTPLCAAFDTDRLQQVYYYAESAEIHATYPTLESYIDAVLNGTGQGNFCTPVVFYQSVVRWGRNPNATLSDLYLEAAEWRRLVVTTATDANYILGPVFFKDAWIRLCNWGVPPTNRYVNLGLPQKEQQARALVESMLNFTVDALRLLADLAALAPTGACTQQGGV